MVSHSHGFRAILSGGGILRPGLLRRVFDPGAKLDGTERDDYDLVHEFLDRSPGRIWAGVLLRHLERRQQAAMMWGVVWCPQDKTREPSARLREIGKRHGTQCLLSGAILAAVDGVLVEMGTREEKAQKGARGLLEE